MVFMKKGATPNKNQQQFKKGKATPSKKVQEDFEEMDDSDDDIDSDEAPQLQKTPLNKGAKGRQSMSEKKVSFSIPAKNSPAVKTPKKDNSILAKKQLTPASKGKTSMQEFKGMKGKKVQADDDDDDDDDEDDDFEMDDEDDIDLDIDDEEDDDEDEEKDDHEGDEDDDDEDEDDEDEDDKDEENDKSSIKKLSVFSPKKEVLKETKGKPVKDDKLQGEILKDEAERRKERNARMLYIGKLPKDVTEQELKGLSKDVAEVSIPMGNRKQLSKTVYAFLTFDTEAKAEANYKSLQTKKFRGQPLTVDYVGEKSSHDKAMQEGKQGLNLKKLFISGLPLDATLHEVAKHFKKAFQITFNICPTFRTAVINFLTAEDAKAAYDASKEITVGGLKVTVLYSRQTGTAENFRRKNRGKRSHKDNQNGGQKNAKKIKLTTE